MKKNKLITAGVLMAVSIILMLLFQAYWMRTAYRDEYKRLRRELSITLRETVTRQQLQIIFANKDKVKDTSVKETKDTNVVWVQRSTKELPTVPGVRITTGISMKMNDADSSKKGKKNRLFFENDRHFDDEINPKEMRVDFPTPFGVDSVERLSREYKKSLEDAGIRMPFTLTKETGDSGMLKGMANFSKDMGVKESRPALFKLKAEKLIADFGNPFFYILKRLQWQLLFAFSMLLVTIAAFIFLYRNLRQQQQLSAIKNDFIANITHELKTPVATVSVAIEALKNFNAINDAERTREYLDISAAELQRLGLLVDKVMKLSMFEQDKMEIRQERIDMRQLTQDVLRSMKLQFEKQHANVLFDYTGDSFYTRGDNMHLQSVVFNLLDNALKYSPEEPEIIVNILAKENTIELTVADNGIGIAPEYRGKVFDKFFRVPHGNTHNIKGYGLGLSYVYEVVQRHGGNIRVESKEGKGSVFLVELKREA